ncbi:hypothetical protein CP974_01940 [Streptomyces fradiae ATCC 10745 = DSM 40063]|uniref:Uncharacterized protein n=3 Tax=Streptomyces TaxID=1883 RepID=A0A1D8FWL6_9ACTN|nr:hypothetical protein A4G23_00373 [Streptomyces rubrolavendulae]OSY50529.1 hypothetical protein BG846_03830 [Streptomyces fradiae ATCC 10745 = DSM 40063]QEV10974.1 hypothetical protein CP974_01940 [Streptomyces fradiae ATCC 10745 = DSM 40063]
MRDGEKGAGRRCQVADPNDPTPCEGEVAAVTVVTGDGREVTGCVHHSARQLASLQGSRLHPMAALMPWAVDVYCRAAALTPFPWEIGL